MKCGLPKYLNDYTTRKYNNKLNVIFVFCKNQNIELSKYHNSLYKRWNFVFIFQKLRYLAG